MIPHYISYKVEIKKLKFETDDGKKYPATALIHFQVNSREKPVVELMGYMGEKEIYGAIDRGEELVLDQCYVGRFSLKDYRLTRNLGEKEKVTIKGFSARRAFFGGQTSLDFSHSVLEGERFDMEGAWISKGDTIFENAHFKTVHTSFHDCRFPPGYFSFKNAEFECEEVSFKNAAFGPGEKEFRFARFGNGNLNFTNVEFSDGSVNFINTDFGGGETSFKIARFGSGKVDFHFASFGDGNVSFERTEFGEGRVDFRTVEFGSGRVNFNRSLFGNGEVNFDECMKEEGKFSFKRATLGTGDFSFEDVMFEHVETSFERTHFGRGKVSFYRSWLKSLSLRFCHLNSYVDLRVKHCGSVDLSSTIVRDIIDMNPHEFASGIGTLSLAGMRLIGRIYTDWRRNDLKRIIHTQGESNYRIRAEQFRILKENFKNLGLYHDEDRAYVQFKRNESRAELAGARERGRLQGILHYPVYWFKRILFDGAGLYATSPGRVLTTMFSCFILFSFIYLLMMRYTSADILASVDDTLSVLERSFYHSAITFLTIGYGDHYPSGAIRWISSIEGFFGLFLMSYFTVAFVRKVLR